jgi:aminopeptidase N
MKPIIILLAALNAFADTYPRQPDIDAMHYVFRLTLSDATDEIAGEATTDIRFLRDGVGEFSLDLAPAMNVSAVTGAARFEHRGERLIIGLATSSKAGERRQFIVRYRGTPKDGFYASTNSFGDRGFFSANWPNLAHGWLPMIDHPYDKATSEFLITAPLKYQVVANGLLQEERDLGDGTRLTHWKQSVPISSWLNAVGVAQFSARQVGNAAGTPISVWTPWQAREQGSAVFDKAARQALEFFSDHVGPFPYEKLANVWATAPGFRGATEHASVIFYACCRTNAGTVWHETAHHWFGDSVTEKDWDDVWLSEGFATYFTLLATEHYEGRDAFVAGLKSSRSRIFELEKNNPGMTVSHHNLDDMKKVLNQIVYQKGGWTLHMLRAQIGTETFWAGIREYYRRYRDSNASADDFRKVMEEASGQDLGWFFAQWLHRAPSPAIDGSWTWNSRAKKIEVDLTQTQPGEAYRLPLEIGTAKIEMTQKQQHFEIPADKAPDELTLDPNTLVLMEAHFRRK